MICSKSSYSLKPASEIVTFARHLTTDTILHNQISTLLACRVRLLPLKKKTTALDQQVLENESDESLVKQSQDC